MEWKEKLEELKESAFKNPEIDDFMLNNAKKIRDAVAKIDKSQKFFRELGKKDPRLDEIQSALDRALRTYNDNIREVLTYYFTHSRLFDVKGIKNIVAVNLSRYGTKPSVVLDAIDDAYDAVKRYM